MNIELLLLHTTHSKTNKQVTSHIQLILPTFSHLHFAYSYRPISLLPIISKVRVKLILKRFNKDMNPHDWIPHHQFGFRQAHSTVQQCHRITDTINKALEDQEYCTALFLDVSQAFDKVWHPGLLFKIKQTLPSGYYNLLKSYPQDRHFVTQFNNKTSVPLPNTFRFSPT